MINLRERLPATSAQAVGSLAFASARRQRICVLASIILMICGCQAPPGPRRAAQPVGAEIPRSRPHEDEASGATLPSSAAEGWGDAPNENDHASDPELDPPHHVVAPAEHRAVALQERLQALRDDVAHLEQSVESVARQDEETNSRQHELERQCAALARQYSAQQQQLSDYRKALDAAYRSYTEQQSAIDQLNRRLAHLQATFDRRRTEDDLALDKVIEGMEQLIQLQASQAGGENRSGRESE